MADEPYGVKHPVAFVPGGDTTRDAFGKHIKEIERIYAKLNELNNHKLDSTTLTDAMKEHIKDSNPHPNYKPPKPELGELEGSLDGSRITGTLTKAKITSANVTGLKGFVESLMPEIPDTGDGIKDGRLSGTGSITFWNGLILKWGSSGKIFRESAEGEYKYSEAFPSQCYCVHLTYMPGEKWKDTRDDTWCQLLEYGREGFRCRRQADDYHSGVTEEASVNYLAIGK